MTKEEWNDTANFLISVYQKSEFLNNGNIGIWFELLEDLDGVLVEEAVKAFVKTSPYPPTIADIRNGCEAIINREYRLRREMREIFDFAKGVYPASLVEKNTMAYWNKLTEGKSWEQRVEKARILRTEIATFVRDAEINGEINNIPTFTQYLRSLIKDD